MILLVTDITSLTLTYEADESTIITLIKNIEIFRNFPFDLCSF